jgi:hypothetical protein
VCNVHYVGYKCNESTYAELCSDRPSLSE